MDAAIFFASAGEWRGWLEEHHATASEVWIGYWKKHTGKATLVWSDAVDEALCFGWIDGQIRRIDDERHAQRFTPRKPGSNWSKVNVEKVARLTEEGRMRPAGLAAFEARREDRTGIYSFEVENDPAEVARVEAALRADPEAWAFLATQAPSYRRVAIHRILSAKREATREKRLAELIADSRAGRKIKALSY
jgi:uncharacterized protein YdeI (YjbR/CyaY-like superfamily)